MMLDDNLNLLFEFWIPFISDSRDADPRIFLALTCLAIIYFSGVWIIPLLKKNLDPASLFSLIPMTGMMTAILFSLLIFVLAEWINRPLNYSFIFWGMLIFSIVTTFVLSFRNRQGASGSTRSLVFLAGLLLTFLIMRLPFIHGLIFPPYSDSVEHYQIIRDLSHPQLPQLALYKLARFESRYYHMGFHAFTAALVALTGSSIEQVMLVLGQILQALIPLSLFLPLKAITKSNIAGLTTVLLAGLCWRMPGFASNWGKYPALTSLAILPLLPSFLWFASQPENSRIRKYLFILSLAGGLSTTLAHTRGLVLLVTAMGCWWLSGKIIHARRLWKYIIIALLISLTIYIASKFFSENSMSFIFAPYVRDGYIPALLILLLFPFGFKTYPRPVLWALLFLLFVLVSAGTPLPSAFDRFGYQFLLDRPFTQTMLFLPLAILGGIGFAGLSEMIKPKPFHTLFKWAFPLIAALGLYYSLLYFELSQSSCCQLAGADDIAAFDWIENNLSDSAAILIAGNHTPTRTFGVDGGAWITSITGYKTIMRSNKTPFNALVILEELCAEGVTHIYAGGTAARFPVEQISSQPEWYKLLYEKPGSYVYRLVGCR